MVGLEPIPTELITGVMVMCSLYCRTLLSMTTSLTAPIVDALSNLNIEKNVAAEVCRYTLSMLNNQNSREISSDFISVKNLHFN